MGSRDAWTAAQSFVHAKAFFNLLSNKCSETKRMRKKWMPTFLAPSMTATQAQSTNPDSESSPIVCRRSKMMLTRRIPLDVLKRCAKARASRKPSRKLIRSQHDGMSDARSAQVARSRIKEPEPVEAALLQNQPVRSFFFHRGIVSFSSKRRFCDPPARYLELSYGLVEPFSSATKTCSNPRATGTLRKWYQAAVRWGILQKKRKPSLLLTESKRIQQPLNLPHPSRRPVSGEGVPSIMHSQWARALGRSPRVIVIGDVHGCIDELKHLLRLADYQPGDQIILLGDLVAKGPDSVAVVQLAREVGARTVRGNHDHEVIRWWEARCRGDQNTVVSLEHANIAKALGPEEHTWLMESPWFIESIDMDHLFVHAGFIPGVKLTQQNPRLMMNMRSVLEDGTVTAKNVPDCAWAKLWNGPQTVVFGHDAFRGLQQYEFAKGIDTGCVYGGRLTALLLPENRFISVAARRAYVTPRRSRSRDPGRRSVRVMDDP